MRRLRKADRPTLLTQNGKTAAVVLSESLYEQLLADAEYGRSVAAIRESLDDQRPDIPLHKVTARLRAKGAWLAKLKR